MKQVIIIRKDLKMRRGKEIAQGSHASMAFLLNGGFKSDDLTEWLQTGQTKTREVIGENDGMLTQRILW